MTDILFMCPNCSQHLVVDGAASGKTLKCVGCGQTVKVPRVTTTFRCPSCMWELSAPTGLSGETFRCPNCDGALDIPSPSRPAPSLRSPNHIRRCPSCGNTVAQDAVICVGCGLDLRTGERRKAVSDSQPTAIGRPDPLVPEQVARLWDSAGKSESKPKPAARDVGFKQRTNSIPWWAVLLFLLLVAYATDYKGLRTLMNDSLKKTAEGKKVEQAMPASAAERDSGRPAAADARDDDQLYGYISVKEKTESPAGRVALLESYLQKHPNGRHVGEVTALLEDARKKHSERERQQKLSTLQVKCFITLGNGSTIPVQGSVQVIRNDQTPQRLKAGYQPHGYAPNDVFWTQGIGEFYRQCLQGGEVVAAGARDNGTATFADVPATGGYFVFGHGIAGRNFIGIWGAAYAEGGKVVPVNVSLQGTLLDANDYEGGLELSVLRSAWKPIGAGNGGE